MTNQEFEQAVLEACKSELKNTIEPNKYAAQALDRLWDSKRCGYFDEDDDQNYFEIPARHTFHQSAYTVS